MTKAEAKEILKYMKSNLNDSQMFARHDEALDLAIKALEQLPCEGCISRQAVLDIVDSYSESRSNVEDVTQDIISEIMVLPFVTPQQKVRTKGKIKVNNKGVRCGIK